MTAGCRADGLRAWKSSSAGTTYFLYDGDTPLLETNSSGVVTAANTFGPDGLLPRRSGGSSVFYAFDPQGSVAERLDPSGAVLTHHVWDAFGVGISTGSTSDPFGFCGQAGYYKDAETGLHLLTRRYYDAGSGRFLTRDLAGYCGGVNLYAYCCNSPVLGSDPSGEGPWWVPVVNNVRGGGPYVILIGVTVEAGYGLWNYQPGHAVEPITMFGDWLGRKGCDSPVR